LAAEALAVADRDVMDDIVEALDADYVPSGNTGPRVSDVGSCRRSVWYRESPPEGFVADPPQYQRQAALGKLIHDKSAEVRSKRYPWRLYETEVTIPGLDKKGRFDEYDPILGEVVDDKTVSVRRWEMVGADGPDESAWGQALLYGLALEDMGLPIQTVRIIVINRDTGDEEHHRRPYDPAAARAVLDDLVELATMLDIGVVPPRDGLGPRADWQCRSCVARSHCWNIPAAEEAGRSPESFTLLGEDPDEQAIIWAGERKLAATKAKNEAEKEEDVAKALIDGIEGEHGDLVFTSNRRSMPEYKESFERAVQLYALPDQDRPGPSEVAEPVRRIDRYTTVRRKRAAKRSKGGKS
jgi:CRISPR/Cas system-associated exonuclease Cas4 (RecB family)